MKVGVISDTHLAPSGFRKMTAKIIQKISEDLESLKALIEPHFKGADAILHAGDLVDLFVLDMLRGFGTVYAVAGNMDPADVRAPLPQKRIVELGKFRIGMIHGFGSPHGLSQRIRHEFAGEKLDCIVFGHSHQPYDRIEDGVLMFNPGSPTDRRFAPRRTIGILHLEDRIWGEHIEMK